MALTQVPSAMLGNAGGELGMRNRIINGGCQIAQRGSVAAVNNAWTYGGCDRIAVSPSGFTTASGTIQQQNFFGTTGYSQSISNLTTTGAGVVMFQERIEAANISDMKGKTVTVSALVYQDTGVTQPLQIMLFKATAKDNWSGQSALYTSNTINVPSGTVYPISATFTLGAFDHVFGLAPTIVFTGVGAVTSKNFNISDFQFEIGAQTNFELRPYGTELMLCQRYYETGYGFAGSRYSDNVATAAVYFKATKRAVPTMTWASAGIGGAPSPQYQQVDSAGWYATSSGASGGAYVSFIANSEL